MLVVVTLLIVLVLLAVAIIVLQFVLRSSSQLGASRGDFERLERELRNGVADGRREAQEAATMNRTELSGNINQFSQTLLAQIKGLTEANERRCVERPDTHPPKRREPRGANIPQHRAKRKTEEGRRHPHPEKRPRKQCPRSDR